MIKYKKIALMLVAFSAIGLSSCGTPSAQSIAEEAAAAATILTEDFQRTKSQLQVISQVVVAISSEKEVAIPITWSADAATAELWEFSEPSKRNIIYCTPTLPEEGGEQKSFTLTATATYKKKTATKTFTGVLMPTTPVVARTISSLAELDPEDNTNITVQGVLRPNYGGGAVVCDVTGCMGIYAKSGLDIYDAGQTAIIKGTYSFNKKGILDPANPSATLENKLEIPQIIYSSMEITDGRYNEIPTDGVTSTTFSNVNAYDANKFDQEGFENISAKTFKLDAKIIKYDGASFHNWEFVPMNATTPYIQFYCNSNVAGNMEELDEYLAPFEGKNVELVTFCLDMNSKNKNSVVTNTWRWVPLKVTAK